MIFAHTHELVMSGRKSQTRRIVKPGEWFWFDGATIEGGQHRVYFDRGLIDDTVEYSDNPRMVYGVGKTYAVQPGRGKKAIGRIRIRGLRREDVREINYEDARAEGFHNEMYFWWTWLLMHDKKAIEPGATQDDFCTALTWQVRPLLMERPAERYQAWVIEFELVNGGAT